ncbi:DUF7221 family queuine tRNA-ribosyltransferase-like protein [Azospirillum formosense]
MLVRVGIPSSFSFFTGVAAALGAPVLISANALRRPSRPKFQLPRPRVFSGCNVALDSAGFVAMSKFGGFPWTVTEYVALALHLERTLGALFSWWSSMDFCCEPEIAADAAEVLRRQLMTVEYLRLCREEAVHQGAKPPMPVLQGWTPDDYERCAALMDNLPPLVGVGSVCRRHLHGPAGLLAVMERLHAILPDHVKLHLFGVKGDGVRALAGHPRLASVDSMAWDLAARNDARLLKLLLDMRPDETVYDLAFRARHLRRWYSSQTAALHLDPRHAIRPSACLSGLHPRRKLDGGKRRRLLCA